MKTKERILLTARTLFNQHGYANVKIADIAEALEISPGNLWYHFKNRKDIHTDIASQFVLAATERMAIRPKGESIITEFAELLNILSQEVNKYRFLYRDQADYGSHVEEISNALPSIFVGTINQYISFISMLRTEGFMAIKNDDIKYLAETLATLLRYSPELLREGMISYGNDAENEKHSFELQCFLLGQLMTQSAATQFRETLFGLLENRQAAIATAKTNKKLLNKKLQ